MNQLRFSFSNEVTEKILRSIQEGLVVCDSEDDIQIMNAAALKIFGITEEDSIVGKPISKLFINAEKAFNFLKDLEKEKQLNQREIAFSKNGGEILCSVSASIVQDSVAGDLLKVIALSDITERELTARKLQEYADRLEKSNKELDQFAYIVSHDLKAPLRAIINLSQWPQIQSILFRPDLL